MNVWKSILQEQRETLGRALPHFPHISFDGIESTCGVLQSCNPRKRNEGGDRVKQWDLEVDCGVELSSPGVNTPRALL